MKINSQFLFNAMTLFLAAGLMISQVHAQESDASQPSLSDDVIDVETDPAQKRERQEFGPWPRSGIRSVSLDIRDTNATVPEDRSRQLLESSTFDWTAFAPVHKQFSWAAPNIKYQPLLFEDVPLERYGQSADPYRQSAISGVNFFTTLTLLPWQVRRSRPWSCDYPLGFCRPGDTVNYTIQRFRYPR